MRIIRVWWMVFVLFLVSFASNVQALVEGMYCGKRNCYDVLGVKRGDGKATIAKAYRGLARKYHPDVYKGKNAEAKFRLIARAYEVLKDDDERSDYDYMLDNPEEIYRHYYHYYRRRVTPKVDIRIVVLVVVTLISIIQYLTWLKRYSDAIKYALRDQRYRNKAIDLARRKGVWDEIRSRKGRRSKEEIRAEEEEVLRQILEESLDIRGGYQKPSLTDVLFLQLCFSPYYMFCYLQWYARWVWMYNIMKKPYGVEERVYLTRKSLNMTSTQWEAISEQQKAQMIDKELWIPENLKAFKEDVEDDMRTKNADNNKHKMYRRYMKNRKPSAMQFD